MSADVRTAFAAQAESCAALGSPFMERLMALIGARLTAETAVGARVLEWRGDVGPSGQSVPLRLAGGLHRLVRDGRAPDLARVYPPHEASDAVLWQAVAQALTSHAADLMAALDTHPQTNEVRRASAVISGMTWALTQVGAMPVILSELGASAGLNLVCDRFCVLLGGAFVGPGDSPVQLRPDWRGGALTPAHPIRVADRRGVDLAPIDVTQMADRTRLMSYIWPDQGARLIRTEAAIEMAAGRVRVDRADAGDWLGRRLARPWEGLHVVFTTITAQYFPDTTREAVAQHLRQAGASTTAASPLLHLAMEDDGRAPGAALTARLWRGSDRPVDADLARVDFHGRWIDWNA